MAEEPQPSNIQEGADLEPVPANAEDRKAAQALSSLNAKSDEDASGPKKEVDVKALGEAMRNLELAQGTTGTGGAGSNKKPEAKKEQEAPKKLIKVDAADVALLVEQLDLSKPRATELLRAHDADALKAMKSWVSAAV
ncbi:Hypothetical predicted protein [Lecanosticta acicola]|uniref:Nascent polypeptide-associated complex subunit alpha-like UBA domain-containing protein n=1 Tax=Lecanosticta acicola TaxID=111012 RepID=A0AAI9EBJ9_9PEZI|nr:Hypothetical predicted protein [Lecanosticta acicola]